MLENIHQTVADAFRRDDANAVRDIISRYPQLKELINEPIGPFDSPAILSVRSRAMLDVLLDAGADIDARSNWWAGSFGLLDNAPADLAFYAIERGATVTAHAAARLGLLDTLQRLIAADPALIHAPGGDGKTPLHFASTVPIAAILLANGANIDARDVDHESTAAQYLLREHPDVVRFLVEHGCTTDILMAAGLGDLTLAQKHLDADPDAIRMRVSNEYFPMIGDGKAGGTIYQWVLGWYVSAVQVARDFRHPEMSALLMDRCPPEEKFLNACWLHDEPLANSLLVQHPQLAMALPPAGRRQLAHAARNNDTIAAKLMLAAGLPVDSYSQHHATPLHWAAWHGNVELVKLILERNPPLENNDNQYGATPLNWTMHGSENAWDRTHSNHPAMVEALLDAGASLPDDVSGTPAVQEVLRRRGAGS